MTDWYLFLKLSLLQYRRWRGDKFLMYKVIMSLLEIIGLYAACSADEVTLVASYILLHFKTHCLSDI